MNTVSIHLLRKLSKLLNTEIFPLHKSSFSSCDILSSSTVFTGGQDQIPEVIILSIAAMLGEHWDHEKKSRGIKVRDRKIIWVKEIVIITFSLLEIKAEYFIFFFLLLQNIVFWIISKWIMNQHLISTTFGGSCVLGLYSFWGPHVLGLYHLLMSLNRLQGAL